MAELQETNRPEEARVIPEVPKPTRPADDRESGERQSRPTSELAGPLGEQQAAFEVNRRAGLAELAKARHARPAGLTDQTLAHAEADPLRKHGRAQDTHPQEWDAAMREAEQAGVEVIFRDGAMAYGPGLSPGRPGQLFLDPDASYGALVHEVQHLRDDREAGWAGMEGWFSKPDARYASEVRAYQQEIDYARSIGDRDSADRLAELLRDERNKIYREDT